MLRAVSQLLVVIVVLAISPTSSEQCVNAVSEMMAEWTSGQSQGNSSRSSTEAVVTWSLHHVSLLCRLDFFLASLSYNSMALPMSFIDVGPIFRHIHCTSFQLLLHLSMYFRVKC